MRQRYRNQDLKAEKPNYVEHVHLVPYSAYLFQNFVV